MTDITKQDAAVLAVLDEYHKTWMKPPVMGVTRGVLGHDGLAMAREIVRLRAAVAAAEEAVNQNPYQSLDKEEG